MKPITSKTETRIGEVLVTIRQEEGPQGSFTYGWLLHSNGGRAKLTFPNTNQASVDAIVAAAENFQPAPKVFPNEEPEAARLQRQANLKEDLAQRLSNALGG